MEAMKLGRGHDRVQGAAPEGRIRGRNDGKDKTEYIIKFPRVKKKPKRKNVNFLNFYLFILNVYGHLACKYLRAPHTHRSQKRVLDPLGL